MLISEEFRIRTSEANFEENKIVIEENKIVIDHRWMQPHPHIAGGLYPQGSNRYTN